MKIPFRSVEISSPETLRRFDAPACFVFASPEKLRDAYGVSRVEPEIDFGQYLVLAVHRGLCRTGGYGVSVTSVERSGSEVDVRLSLKDPEPGAMVIMILTYPSVHVLVPRKSLAGGEAGNPATEAGARAGTAVEAGSEAGTASAAESFVFSFSDPTGRIRSRVVGKLD